jgi:hypothetical protein
MRLLLYQVFFVKESDNYFVVVSNQMLYNLLSDKLNLQRFIYLQKTKSMLSLY